MGVPDLVWAAVGCAVLSQRTLLRGVMYWHRLLDVRHAICGTEIGYAAARKNSGLSTHYGGP
eukprot:3940355-Rhodomonas_salina.1